MDAQIYDPKMKEVTVMSDDDAPLARKRKSSTSDAADGGKKKKTEGGAPKRVLPPWRRKRRKPPGCLPKRPPSVSFLFSDIVSFNLSYSYTYAFCTFQEESHNQPQEVLQDSWGF